MTVQSARITDIVPDEACEVDGQPGLFSEDGGIAATAITNAVGVWAACQNKQPKLQEAARAFNATEDVIRRVIEHHYWLFLNGEMIEMEGL